MLSSLNDNKNNNQLININDLNIWENKKVKKKKNNDKVLLNLKSAHAYINRDFHLHIFDDDTSIFFEIATKSVTDVSSHAHYI